MTCRILTFSALLTFSTLPGLSVSAAFAQNNSSEERITECEDSLELPVDATEEARRIACEIPDKYRNDVATAQFIGREIRRHDMAAWLTTDALSEIGALQKIPGSGRGWLTFEQDNSILVRYYSESDGVVSSFAEATLAFEPFGARDARRLDPGITANMRETKMLRARLLAGSQKQLRCTKAQYNTVTFEMEEGNETHVLVFLMPPLEENNAPFGGYEMYRLNSDGDQILDRFAQTTVCLNGIPEKLAKVDSVSLAHVTSATPTMFHVFMSLQYRKTFLVKTTQNDMLWKIRDGRIEVLRVGDPDYPAFKKIMDKVPQPHKPTSTSSPIG